MSARAVRILSVAAMLAALGSAALAGGCRQRDACGVLAERDCARYGESSATCRDSRARAASADEFLANVCRRILDRGEDAWGTPGEPPTSANPPRVPAPAR